MMNFKNEICWGTGIMIGPHIVLTAGSNLYDFNLKEYAQIISFLPGMNGDEAPFGVIEVEQYFVSPKYITEGKEDYGILVIKEPIGERTGYFGLACLESEEIKAKRINVVGYPYDKVANKPCSYEMWGMEGTAYDIDKAQGVINYLIDTEHGQSGSGVWYQEGEDYYVCGVHVEGFQSVKKATLLTKDMFKQIHTWLQRVSSKDLLFRLKDAKTLELREQEIDSKYLHIVMRYSLEDLTILDLAWNRVEDEGAKVLGQNTSWINLSQLDLSGNNIGAEGAKALAQNTSWVNLAQLHLSDNNMGAEGAKALAQNTSWANLSQLYLQVNNVGTEGAKALAQNTSWTNLTYLYLSDNNIGAEGAKALAQNTSWVNLSQLYLQWNNIGAEGAKTLAQNTSWINLSHLDLSKNNIGAEEAKLLRQNKTWKKNISFHGI